MKPNYDIDERLESQSQKGIQKLVRELPEESPSLAWRSQLNEQIRALAEPPKRKPFWHFVWKPATGLAVAGALAAVMLMSQRPSVPVPVATESSNVLLAAHQQGSTWAELETSPATTEGSVPPLDDLSELDLQPL